MSAKLLISALLASLSMACTGDPSPAGAADPVVAGATTLGGVAENTQVIHVTSLADTGEGSLRAALDVQLPRVIVFDVGGRINLGSDLIIRQPYVTIAGQTAPSPGISLWGASMRIRTHDVVVQHIAVRAGPSTDPKVNGNRDGISMDGNPQSKNTTYQVRLENVSVSWSVDEAVSTWAKTTHNITVRSSIVSEALNNAGHPKGKHSMGLLVGANVGAMEVVGNMLASNRYRNPVVAHGASTYIGNNFVVNPGWAAIHLYMVGPQGTTHATIVNNLIEPGKDTQPFIRGVDVPSDPKRSTLDEVIYIDGNEGLDFGPGMSTVGYPRKALRLAVKPPVTPLDWKPMPAKAVKDWVLRYAGTRPADRDPIDKRLLKQIAAGTERIIDHPTDAGPIPDIAETHRVAEVPSDPLRVSSATGKSRLQMWLCLEHLKLGGAPSEQCPESVDALKAALAGK